MYNIDFKVCGQLVSIQVTAVDSLATLIQQMIDLSAFHKYSKEELEQKLVKNLAHISSHSSTDPQIRNRLTSLLNPRPLPSQNRTPEPNPKPIPSQNITPEPTSKPLPLQNITPEPTLNPANNTFVNLLHDTTINNSYIASGAASQTKLRRKYISNQNILNDEKSMLQKLKFNYDHKNAKPQQNYDHKNTKPQPNHTVNSHVHSLNHNPPINKRSFSYLYQQPAISTNPSNNYRNQNHPQNLNRQYHHSPTQSPSKHQKAYNYNAENDSVLHKEYNPVPRLNELIQKSKSLTKMINLNTGISLKERNLNIVAQNRKLPIRQDPFTIQKRTTAGKIHHRQQISTLNAKSDIPSNPTFIRSKPTQNQQSQKNYETDQFQLKRDYSQSKPRSTLQSAPQSQFPNQAKTKQNIESVSQGKRNTGAKTGIYSYL